MEPRPAADPYPGAEFDRPFDRTGTGSIKWARAGAAQDGVIALGLADMDLPGPPAVAEALAARAAHRAYGYTLCDPGGRELVSQWYRDRHDVAVDPDWVLLLPFSPRTALRLLLEAIAPTGPVLIPTPEWAGFAEICGAAGLPYQEIALSLEGDGYRLPTEEFARRRPGAIVLSNPHNPSGRVWTPSEIRALAEAAADGGTTGPGGGGAGRAAGSGGVLLSDEVHGDLLHPDHGLRHPVAVVAAGDLARHTVTLNSVGKTFNTSGIPSCFALVPDPALRSRLTGLMAGFGLWEGGLLEQTVQQAALQHGGPWLDALLRHLVGARERLTGVLGSAVVSRPQSSYLLWLDAGKLGLPAEGARVALLERCGLELSEGTGFGEAGIGQLRLNYALPTPLLATVEARLRAL
ncbi:aminotransferase class I/II-fold pyridoxal phosphate-dependent enzyme [Kitasatospora sp. NBC_00240]|uniref:aminotransferase class I/II-fold pyridoxal phosphate-dependent enzyme n=1 Tax=Kitasatospora sp. NBC_00240 TaxID=2903567 RepID=UPI002252AFF0|nr:aminotransferase class I/II-fold pyridoxal phosphate-dependent enzyme [Kitasatospora sp. NBC_00240]MCX5209461.1 aminotransferase class I/II-fold pyridoxal phosphate-dependent enzyme [Kitasatospora sp. NBC_00240]